MDMRTPLALVAAAALALGLAGCGEDATAGHDAVAIGGQFEFVSPGGQTVIEYPPAERAPVGEVYGPDLRDESEEIRLADFAGQIVVLNAWGQWCAPCRAESDDLQRVHEWMRGEGIGTVLGVNVRDDVITAPRDFMADNGLTYPSIYDPPFINAAALGGIPASVIPTTVILDRRHRPAAVLLKGVDDRELTELVRKIAAEEP